MICIKIYQEKKYYTSKYGNKEYLIGNDTDDVLIKAAILTGKGLNSEESLIYEAYGDTVDDAEKAIDNYLKANQNHPPISRKEIIE